MSSCWSRPGSRTSPMIEMAGGRAIPVDARSGRQLAGHPRGARSRRHAADPRHHGQLAEQPDRPRHDDDELEAIADVAERARSAGLRRRDVREDPLRRPRAHQHRLLARDVGADADLQRSLQGLRDDRLAARLRGRTAGVHRRDRQGPQPFGHLRHLVRPGRRRRRPDRAAGVHRRDGGRLGPPPPHGLRRPRARSRAFAARRSRARFMPSPTSAAPGCPRWSCPTCMLQEAHVAVVPGVAFGEAGEGHVRLSFATPTSCSRRPWFGWSAFSGRASSQPAFGQ